MALEQTERHPRLDNECNSRMNRTGFRGRPTTEAQVKRGVAVNTYGGATAHECQRCSSHWLIRPGAECSDMVAHPVGNGFTEFCKVHHFGVSVQHNVLQESVRNQELIGLRRKYRCRQRG